MRDPRIFYGDLHPEMKLADIHLHTTHSDGWWTPERLVHAAIDQGLSAIAITDHDEIRGGMLAREYVARRGLDLQVLVGQEVSTRAGGRDVHVLGLDLEDEIRPWQSIEATVDAIYAQGGFVIMPHPKASGRGWPSFEQVLGLGRPVAVEIYNAGVADLAGFARLRGKIDANLEARAFFEEHRANLAGAVGGTDGHFRTVGRGLTAYTGDLRTAIEGGTTSVLFRPNRERLMPWDPAGYIGGLKRLDRRRSEKYGPRPR